MEKEQAIKIDFKFNTAMGIISVIWIFTWFLCPHYCIIKYCITQKEETEYFYAFVNKSSHVSLVLHVHVLWFWFNEREIDISILKCNSMRVQLLYIISKWAVKFLSASTLTYF